MTLSRSEIAGFVAAALFLHLAGFYWAFWGRPTPPGAIATGSGGIMIDLAGQVGTGGAPKGNTPEPVSDPEPQPIEKITPPEPEPVVKPEPQPKPKPVHEKVVKPEPKPKPKPKPKVQPRKEAKAKPPQDHAQKQGRPDGSAEVAEGNSAGKPGLASQGEAGDGESAGGGTPGARADYRAIIIGRLAREKRYPMRARMRGSEGTGLLRLVIAADGSVVSARIEKSSGSSILDDEIEQMVERAAPFPPFPKNMGRGELTMRIPVEFKLR